MTTRGRITVLAFGVAVALALSEGGLRLAGQFEPPPPAPVPRRPDLYRPDPELGYTLWPSKTTMYRYPERIGRELALVSNADGFRSPRAIDEPDTRPRIWMLGDSMVFGDGVTVEERLTEVMERLEPKWRVDNLGMTGWGLDAMVRAATRFRARVRADVVVLGFYTDDFRRLGPRYSGMGYASMKFDLVDGNLVDVAFPGPLPVWRRLRIVQAVEQTQWRFTRNRFDLNEALLNRLRAVVGADATLAVVFVPGRGDTDEDKQRRGFLRDWCARSEVPFLDLTDKMQREGNAAYIENNPHWNERGHAVAGAAIREFLRGRVPMTSGS